jgi:uncharacterized protein DUF3455
MIYSSRQISALTAKVRWLLLAAAVLVPAVAILGDAAAQGVIQVVTPKAITPPPGNVAFLFGHASGTQGYTCLPTGDGTNAWTVNPARPEATLFTDVLGQPEQIVTHFLSPNLSPNQDAPKQPPTGGNATWQSSSDSSRVWATATGHIDAGSDASCPNTGSLPCLLLQSIGNMAGPSGGDLLDEVTYIQRLNTKGGSAPKSACSTGQSELVGYTADYYFFRAMK